MTPAYDELWIDCRLATLRRGADVPYGAVEDAALAVRDGRIVYAGPRAGIDENAARDARVRSAEGRWITPALVDCHTHLVYAGNRAREFEMRLAGATYEEIARAGGGIVSTVKATRAATEAQLVTSAARRLAGLKAEGVTLVEIKSGYGLDLDTELRMLRAARRLGREDADVEIVTTFLGAHALPPEYAGRADDYIDFVCNEVLPAVAAEGLADAVDCFCERIGFTPAQTMQVFEAARRLGLPVKLHAEQLSDQGGAVLAARFGALSADHLEYLTDDGIAAMAAAGTVAVLLPGAFYFLRETKLPPIEGLRAAGVPIALATDSNPGSSPVGSLLLMLSMACTLFRMTPEEGLAAITREGARALGRGDDLGTLEPGRQADFVLWDVDHPSELAYRIGVNPCSRVFKAGQLVL